MDIESPPKKKRRTPKACAGCRRSKLACDLQRPCGRCVATRIECEFFEPPRDSTVERLEAIEQRLASMDHSIQSIQNIRNTADVPIWPANRTGTRTSLSWTDDDQSVSVHAQTQSHGRRVYDFRLRHGVQLDCVSSGKVTDYDARNWFATFFDGCNRFVPIFDSDLDTYDSIRNRSRLLFDTLIIYGCRAANGALSMPYQQLYPLLRQHTSDLVLQFSVGSRIRNDSIESIQALLVIASYADSGSVLCDVALRFSIESGLPDSTNELFSLLNDEGTSGSMSSTSTNQQLTVAARVWYGLFVLDQILSLDGGKPPSVILTTPPQRVRALLRHLKTPIDIRLLAQVELNALRATSYESIHKLTDTPYEDNLEDHITSIVAGSTLDLDLWLSEWQGAVTTYAHSSDDRSVLMLNIRIQHAWAQLALHLRALTACGIENIVLMTSSHRALALAAKCSAERHLSLLLTDTTTSSRAPPQASSPTIPNVQSKKPYVANFRYAMEFVWAKNAFCVLIVLRLGILLGDELIHLKQRLQEANEFLQELEKVGMGANISYMRILAETVGKCERAVSALEAGGDRNGSGNDVGGEAAREHSRNGTSEFQSFIPKEFMFEWDFPGLNLCYIPLDWQDLFLDFGGASMTSYA